MGDIRNRFIAPVITIDTLVQQWRPPGFIKIDVEGAELLVLEGARQTLMRHRPLMLVEVNSMRNGVRELFAQFGYKMFAPAEGGELIDISQCAFNTFAVPEEKAQLIRPIRS